MKQIDVAKLKQTIGFFPHDCQKNILKNQERFTVVVGGKRVGKCKDLNSPILMADGTWKKLREIRRGDFVIGADYNNRIAEPTRVMATTRSGYKKIYRVNFYDGGFVEASPEHEFPTSYRSGVGNEYFHHGSWLSKIKKRRLSEIISRGTNKSESKRTRFLQPKVTIFSNHEKLEIHPYLLGVLLGDGCLTKKAVSFSNTDEGVISRTAEHLSRIGYKLNSVGNGKDYRIVRSWAVKSFWEIVKKIGLNGKYSDTKFVPSNFKTASVKDRKELLAGLIDTDGTIKEYCTKSERLAEDFVFLIKSLGGFANKKYSIRRYTYKGEKKESFAWRCYWKLNIDLPLSISRKQNHSKRERDYSQRTVKSIEYLGERECGDIQVEHPDHCYISDDWIITGNTILASYLALKELFLPYHSTWIIAPNHDLTSRIWEYLDLWIDRYFGGGIGSSIFRINKHEKIIENKMTGAKLWTKTGENPSGLLGKGLDLAIVDEASRMGDGLWDGYIRPNLMDKRGRLFAISNPFGFNYFYDLYLKGTEEGRENDKDYISFIVPTAIEDELGNVVASNNPNAITVEELRSIKASTPVDIWKQEYLSVFQEGAGQRFKNFEKCIDDLIKINDPNDWFEDPIPGHLYFVGVDIAKVEDFTVVTVVDRMTHRLVGFYRINNLSWNFMRQKVLDISKKYGDAEITIDATGTGGDIFSEDLLAIGANVDTKFVYTNTKKNMLIDKLAVLMDRNKIKFPRIPQLINEIRSFTYHFTTSGNMVYGSSKKDDCINSIALACWKLNDEPIEGGGGTFWMPARRSYN